MLKKKGFKTIYYSAGNQCYQRKVVPLVNLVIPPVVNRLISVGRLRAVAIKHLVELSVEHEFLCHFFSKRKTCHVFCLKTYLDFCIFRWKNSLPYKGRLKYNHWTRYHPTFFMMCIFQVK